MVSMCNKRIECVSGVDKIVDNQQHTNQTPDSMDTPTSVTNSTPSSVDDSQRVKLLCSFLGSIMPRPQDGKLRYVGGETRIVSLPMDIGYEELMNKMRELYDAVAVVKYQQPDEDLDALVSVVNDDDVTNMMEEYEKLGSGDGFTRLRIFLFPHPDQDGSLHYIDGNGRDNERRYVDALNNVNDGNDFRRNPDSPLIGQIDDILVNDQFLNPTSLEGSFHGQRGGEMPIPQYNLHHVAVPQRYNELDGGPWSPAYYSPGFHGHHDPRQLSEFAETPSSARHRMPFGELPDRDFERMPEEYARPHPNHALYDHQPGYSENLVWMPTGDLSSDRAGFPPNILHGPSCFEGNRVAFQRNQLQMEQHMGGGPPPQVSNIGAEGSSNRDTFITNTDAKAHHIIYQKDQNDPLPVYNGTQNQERRGMQHQLSPHADEVRAHIPGCGRFNENYVGDGPGMNYSFGHGSMVDGHHMSSSYVHHRPGPELSNEVFHEPANGLHQLRIANPDESSVRYANFPYACGAENIQSMPHGHMHVQNSWRNTQNPVQGVPYEIQSSNSRVNYSINSTPLRGMIESNHRYGNGMDFQRQWVESSQGMLGLDAKPSPIYSQNHLMSSNHNACAPENRQSFSPEPVRLPVSQEMLNISPNIATSGYIQGMPNATAADIATEKDVSSVANNENLNARKSPSSEQKKDADGIGKLSESIDSNVLMLPEQNGNAVNVTRLDTSAVIGDSKLMPENLSFLPKLMASVKKAALEEAEVVKAKVEENSDPMYHNSRSKGSAVKESEATNAHEESEPELDSDNIDINKIEPTKAEEEAIERGLQTIKNEDLEEIRELGSGTYGAVYHGKWKGSDVAIKRIKASCFAGKPSERERLIADFWKEALILSSLHHPNVVSFYGIVRDGPDGSLATVTEFMINGSLKQFLQKKDRTIDRRKRLIIAMDAAFGMEYLHGKNIVHFDLKCENLLVNMRDPQRPICKIGDLGLSKVKQHTLVSGGVRGTLPWMAPELLSGKGQMVTEKIDVYSFGIVMWELLTGEEPYADMHCASIIGGIVNNTLRPKIPTWCDPEWKSLMESCWACDPADRPSFSEISRKLRSMAAAMNVK